MCHHQQRVNNIREESGVMVTIIKIGQETQFTLTKMSPQMGIIKTREIHIIQTFILEEVGIISRIAHVWDVMVGG